MTAAIGVNYTCTYLNIAALIRSYTSLLNICSLSGRMGGGGGGRGRLYAEKKRSGGVPTKA